MTKAWQRIASDLVDEARKAGFEVRSFDMSNTGNPLLDRAYYMWATEEEITQFYEWGQP